MRTANIVVHDPSHLQQLLQENSGTPHYTYLLRKPDGIVCLGGVGTPFYCGIGTGGRLFSHVKEVQKGMQKSRKAQVIAAILDEGKTVLHCIDGFFDKQPWDREEYLIRTIGQVKHGTGPLTNEQDYAPSYKLNGIELRKYATTDVKDADTIPPGFDLRSVRLTTGSVEPKSRRSVHGKIYSVVEEHPGVTGEELVALLKRIDFSDNPSAYTQSGEVCAAWLCGYITGGFRRKDRRHLQRYTDDLDGLDEA
jgi:hypothetical protein